MDDLDQKDLELVHIFQMYSGCFPAACSREKHRPTTPPQFLLDNQENRRMWLQIIKEAQIAILAICA